MTMYYYIPSIPQTSCEVTHNKPYNGWPTTILREGITASQHMAKNQQCGLLVLICCMMLARTKIKIPAQNLLSPVKELQCSPSQTELK